MLNSSVQLLEASSSSSKVSLASSLSTSMALLLPDILLRNESKRPDMLKFDTWRLEDETGL